MNAGDIAMIRTNIALLIKLRDDYLERLADLHDYDDMQLKRSPRYSGKLVYYYGKKSDSSKYSYIGNASVCDVNYVKEVHFIREAISRINSNIDLFKNMLTSYQHLDYDSINNSLSITYRDANIQSQLEKSEKIAAWKKEMLGIKASYPIKRPEQLIHTYVDSTKMRSKSELNVALSLDFYNVPFVYEVPIEIDGYVIYPDFRLLSPADLTTEYLLEQFGRMDLDDYQESVGWKISKYMKKGFMPNINFFMNFDDIYGNADLRPLHEIIFKISGRTELAC